MSNTALAPQNAPETLDPGHDNAVAGYIEDASRYNGSRTSPQKTALVHLMKREGRTVNAIASILGMNERTVKAILSRSDHLVADARMLLQANALGFAGDAIQASQEAAKRGKIEGISAMLDRLGVTEPPKTNAGVQVGVQVVLHGGEVPSELGVSLAKVGETREGPQNQAGTSDGLIMRVMDTVAIAPQPTQSQRLTATDHEAKVTQDADGCKPGGEGL